MLFLAFWYQLHLHSSKIALMRAILSHLEFSTDSGKICISKSFMGKCSQKLNFWAIKMGLVTKCSKEHFPVRGQWSGVRVQGSGVKTGVKYQDLGLFWAFSQITSTCDPYFDPWPWPLTPDWEMLFWAFWYQSHLHSPKIELVRAFTHETPGDAGFTRISGKLEVGENCSHEGNF